MKLTNPTMRSVRSPLGVSISRIQNSNSGGILSFFQQVGSEPWPRGGRFPPKWKNWPVNWIPAKVEKPPLGKEGSRRWALILRQPGQTLECCWHQASPAHMCAECPSHQIIWWRRGKPWALSPPWSESLFKSLAVPDKCLSLALSSWMKFKQL